VPEACSEKLYVPSRHFAGKEGTDEYLKIKQLAVGLDEPCDETNQPQWAKAPRASLPDVTTGSPCASSRRSKSRSSRRR